ncbi:hypothetical protein EXIGLDRAFT_760872 [Exidia glandulosa HHB12029]|uniref:F-box domain-containing protein n=1 Tax=Exidia glandulosa HHB12029 TaxID=1314781 RepID=A0A165NY39_EXIGL|nr:hypothetical protein EXIGLDRAFT_760872 [Exidia glandulosa HHB12029]
MVSSRDCLARVCAYWRAVALDYPTFWAHIVVRTSRDAALLAIALERSSGGVLDVELCDERISSAVEQRAVVETLLAPEHRLRLIRLSVKYTNMMPESLLPLLCAGDVFPALHDLVIQGTYGRLPYLAPSLEAPSLRTLVLSGLELVLQSWHTFITPSLEHLCLHVVQYDDSYRLLNTIPSAAPSFAVSSGISTLLTLCRCWAMEYSRRSRLV